MPQSYSLSVGSKRGFNCKISINIKPFVRDVLKKLKVSSGLSIKICTVTLWWRQVPMAADQRKPVKNTAFSVHFIVKGAEKRRSLAYAKAKMLQSELGVTPHLVSVK
jgi:hypothetical protein